MESRVEGLIRLLHDVTDKPVAVGFGVSGPDQVLFLSHLLLQLALCPCYITKILTCIVAAAYWTAAICIFRHLTRLMWQAQQLVRWGAEGVIVGSALVKALGMAKSPEEGLKEMSELAKTLRAAIP